LELRIELEWVVLVRPLVSMRHHLPGDLGATTRLPLSDTCLTIA